MAIHFGSLCSEESLQFYTKEYYTEILGQLEDTAFINNKPLILLTYDVITCCFLLINLISQPFVLIKFYIFSG